MTTIAERAEVIREIQARLADLDGRVQGSTLRADDWNGLVGAVGRLAKLSALTATDDGSDTELSAGSVTFGHLADDVRRLLKSGPYADAEERNASWELDRRLQSVERQLGSLESRVDSLLGALTDAQADLARGKNESRNVTHRLEGVVSLSDEVEDLRSLLGSVREDVGAALAMRDDLDQVDVATLAARLVAFEDFRNAWSDENNNVVGFDGFVRRLEEVRAASVTDEELQDAVDARLSNVRVDPDALRSAVAADMQTQLAAARDDLESDMDRRLATTAEDLRATTTQQVQLEVAARLEGLDPRITDVAGTAAAAVVADTLDDRVDAVRAEVMGEVDGRLADLDDRLGVRVDDATRALANRVDAVAADKLDAGALDEALAGVSARFDEQLTALDQRVTGEGSARKEGIAGLRRERTAAIAEATARTEAVLRADLRREATERDAAIVAGIDGATRTMRDEVGALEDQFLAQAKQLAASEVDVRFGGAEAALEKRLRVVIQDAGAAIEADIVDIRRQIEKVTVTRPGGVFRPAIDAETRTDLRRPGTPG